MIATVTTSTVTTITSVAFAASLEIVIVLALLIFLIQKEIFSFTATPKAKTVGKFLSKALNIAVIPLLISFGFIVFVKVAAVIG